MAMGIGFGYYAYFDARRMWRGFDRLDEGAGQWEQWSTWFEGFYQQPNIRSLREPDLYGDVERSADRRAACSCSWATSWSGRTSSTGLFTTLNIASKNIPGSMGVAALITCALFATATGIVGAVVTLDGPACAARHAQGAL